MRAIAGAALGLLVAGGAAATDSDTDVLAARDATRAELAALNRDIELTEERRAELEREIAALDRDGAALNEALLRTGERIGRLEARLGETETRLGGLLAAERRLRDSLAERRGVLSEVLAALQRIRRRPPPAIVVRADDALQSVRSAMLLGAVVPELRDAADRVSADLAELVSLRREMARERERLRTDAESLAEERARIGLLIAQKRRARDASEEALAAERRRAEELASQAGNLEELIARMEVEIEATARAAIEARRASLAREAGRGADPAAPTSLGEAGRIRPAVAFADARGLLPQPVAGTELRAFGAPDGLGGVMEGMAVAARAGAQVRAPADGWVVFAGPFRSYGELLIVNAGDGYHILLAGMERIDVELGQFVLAGEPVAVMGDRRLASVGAPDIGAAQPVLYVEFRKDGTAIDPRPWWAGSQDEKVGG